MDLAGHCGNSLSGWKWVSPSFAAHVPQHDRKGSSAVRQRLRGFPHAEHLFASSVTPVLLTVRLGGLQ
jgi:hypothetical protein